jgi:hypothetical protein
LKRIPKIGILYKIDEFMRQITQKCGISRGMGDRSRAPSAYMLAFVLKSLCSVFLTLSYCSSKFSAKPAQSSLTSEIRKYVRFIFGTWAQQYPRHFSCQKRILYSAFYYIFLSSSFPFFLFQQKVVDIVRLPAED